MITLSNLFKAGKMAPVQAMGAPAPAVTQGLSFQSDPNKRQEFKGFMSGLSARQNRPAPMPAPMPNPMAPPMPMGPAANVDIFEPIEPQGFQGGGAVPALQALHSVTGDAARAIHQLSVGASGGFGGGFGGAPLGMMGGIGGGSRMGFGSTPTAPSYAAPSSPPQTATAGSPPPMMTNDIMSRTSYATDADYGNAMNRIGMGSLGRAMIEPAPTAVENQTSFKDFPSLFNVIGNAAPALGFEDGGEVPRETTIGGMPHMLSYITPGEAAALSAMGGTGQPGPGGIPSFVYDEAGMGAGVGSDDGPKSGDASFDYSGGDDNNYSWSDSGGPSMGTSYQDLVNQAEQERLRQEEIARQQAYDMVMQQEQDMADAVDRASQAPKQDIPTGYDEIPSTLQEQIIDYSRGAGTGAGREIESVVDKEKDLSKGTDLLTDAFKEVRDAIDEARSRGGKTTSKVSEIGRLEDLMKRQTTVTLSGDKKAPNASKIDPTTGKPVDPDARTVSSLEQLGRRAGGAGFAGDVKNLGWLGNALSEFSKSNASKMYEDIVNKGYEPVYDAYGQIVGTQNPETGQAGRGSRPETQDFTGGDDGGQVFGVPSGPSLAQSPTDVAADSIPDVLGGILPGDTATTGDTGTPTGGLPTNLLDDLQSGMDSVKLGMPLGFGYGAFDAVTSGLDDATNKFLDLLRGNFPGQGNPFSQ